MKARDKIAAIVCGVLGHSHLVTNCMGYKHCARCSALLGDTVASIGLSTGKGGHFQIGQTCRCFDCRQAFDSLTWKDRFMCREAVWPTEEYVEQQRAEKKSLIKRLVASC